MRIQFGNIFSPKPAQPQSPVAPVMQQPLPPAVVPIQNVSAPNLMPLDQDLFSKSDDSALKTPELSLSPAIPQDDVVKPDAKSANKADAPAALDEASSSANSPSAEALSQDLVAMVGDGPMLLNLKSTSRDELTVVAGQDLEKLASVAMQAKGKKQDRPEGPPPPPPLPPGFNPFMMPPAGLPPVLPMQPSWLDPNIQPIKAIPALRYA